MAVCHDFVLWCVAVYCYHIGHFKCNNGGSIDNSICCIVCVLYLCVMTLYCGVWQCTVSILVTLSVIMVGVLILVSAV